MFRSRKYSTSQRTEPTLQSSLSSGNASIKRTAPAVVTEEQQPSYYTTQQEQSEEEYEDYNVDEIIDLQATAPTTPANEMDLTIESMSAVIAAAVQMSSQKGGAKSSLSLGSASILQPFSKTEGVAAASNTPKRRFSTRLFSSWSSKTTSSGATSPSTPTTPGLEPSTLSFDSSSNVEDEDNLSQGEEGTPRSSSVSSSKIVVADDGRDELAYRGIQIKEIKTTLKTLVISDEVRYPMPEVKLERPSFARINY
jgi:hypothetical protein